MGLGLLQATRNGLTVRRRWRRCASELGALHRRLRPDARVPETDQLPREAGLGLGLGAVVPLWGTHAEEVIDLIARAVEPVGQPNLLKGQVGQRGRATGRWVQRILNRAGMTVP